ncbi:hypothetical protein [Burkholderia pseudomallei]|uniref:hypothetical protein n=1 Tax=Burkholderia pseudomallei TaxID=28450 RepID=UPI00053756CC|nr:hypothetical protein [Burkholderia pseudomallei]KGX17650.1 hypothetical protein X896_2752 [Burkholderia pseudomallei ABCPW 1]
MTFRSAFRYLKAHAEAHRLTLGTVQRGVPVTAPLGAVVGSLLQVQETPVIRAQSAGSLFDSPAAPQNRIVAISRVGLDVGGSLWRLFTTAPHDLLNDDCRFLQIYLDSGGHLAEAMLCTRLASFTPDPADLPLYRGHDQAGLGSQTYSLYRHQLASIGLSDAELRAAMGDADRLSFARDLESERAFVPPLFGTERRVDDARGHTGTSSEIWFVPYVRELADGSPEYLLIQLTLQRERNGDPAQRAVVVQLWIGLPIEAERIRIL